jgi:protein-histidine pros-kinase
MGQAFASDSEDQPGGSIRGMIAALAQSTPRQVIENLERALDVGGSHLPPQVFFETVEQSAIAISITDVQARILYANRAFEAVTGYAATEIVGQNQSVLSFKTTPRSVYDAMWRTLQAQQTWSGRLVNRRKDGTRYLAELSISPILDADGNATYFLGMHRDITAIQRLERQVQNQKTLIENVVDLAPVAFALLDDQERVVLDNHEYKKLIGDLGVNEPSAHLLAALRASMGDAFDEARTNGRGFAHQEIRCDRSGGRAPRWFSCSGSWFEDEDTSADAFFEPRRRAYMLLAINEISLIKRQQEEQRMSALRSILAEGELTQSLREAIAGAIYQLQGPINLIEAAASMLGRRGVQPDSLALVGVLREAVAAGNRAIETLRGSMPAEPAEAEVPVNINELLHEVLVLLTDRLLAAGVTVDWKPAPVLAAVPGRPTQLRNVFKQLIENAIEAMNERRGTPRELRILTRPEAEGVGVYMEDTGPGIPEELRRKVFEPFFTTKRAFGGSAGMGLAIAQEIISRHQGLIEIDPRYAGGCRMHLCFPVRHRSLEAA